MIEYDCPEDGDLYRVWGTGMYSNDSSVCTAAVHQGVITLQDGGRVRIVIQPGQPSYTGTTRHGVVSQGYRAWGGSFSIESACTHDFCAYVW